MAHSSRPFWLECTSACCRNREDVRFQLALSPAEGHALSAELNSSEIGSRLKKLLSDPKLSKSIHDLKSAMHVFVVRNLELDGVHHDPMLYSYLLDPTSSSHRLPEVALRRFNLKLSGTLPEAADVTGRLTAVLRNEVARVQAE